MADEQKLKGALRQPALKYRKVSSLLTSSFSFVYFCAFASIYAQFPGLYGARGVLPVQTHLAALSSSISSSLVWDRILHTPTVSIILE
jgi:hypothetical protein